MVLAGVSLGLRGLQILFGAVIVGLSAHFITSQRIGSAPTTTKYSVFTGAYGIIEGLFGIAALFASFIPDVVVLGADAVGALVLLAGGIAWAIGTRSVSCTDIRKADKIVNNDLLNQGKQKYKGEWIYGIFHDNPSEKEAWSRLQDSCKRGLADEIFQFLGFAVLVGLVVVGWLRWRGGRGDGWWGEDETVSLSS
ncbi:marvel domain-containing protein [Sordaria brevicollis]|uniref:Marvel domain-containing protein n=1 Tax=Sordaria brevicollis TaxID=83679 RepID=A0AAE0PFG4_SORBR|nr:marvel domain-containing protein [Sordaria brevicollis]